MAGAGFGMHAQGFDVELRQLGDHWRANFYVTGIAPLARVRLRVGRDAVARSQPRGAAGDRDPRMAA